LAATLHFPLVTGITAGIKTAPYTYPPAISAYKTVIDRDRVQGALKWAQVA